MSLKLQFNTTLLIKMNSSSKEIRDWHTTTTTTAIIYINKVGSLTFSKMMTEECILNYDLFRISTLIIMTHLLGTFKNWVNDCLIDMSDFLENKFVCFIERLCGK